MSWAVKGLGGGDADFRAGVGGDDSGGEAGDGGADDVADGEGLAALGDEFLLGGDGVCGFSGLWVMRRPSSLGLGMGSR